MGMMVVYYDRYVLVVRFFRQERITNIDFFPVKKRGVTEVDV